LRNCQLCSHSRIYQHFMESEGLLPCSQEPSTVPYPEPDQFSPYHLILSLSNICLSRDRSIASSKLRSPKSAILSLSPDEASRIFFGERLSRKSCNVVVFPFAFHIAVQQPLNPLWSRLLLCDPEPSQPYTVLCFMSLLKSLLPTSGEFVSEFPSPRVILSFFPPP
jgi:hypothetical protein